jgi:hypothetical protein
MEEQITIIEGPSPVFELVDDSWGMSVNEGTQPYDVALTRLRTFNGPALVERCVRTWRQKGTIYLRFRDETGEENQTPILAAQYQATDGGEMLLLWVRIPHVEESFEGDDDDSTGEDYGDFDDDFGDSGVL